MGSQPGNGLLVEDELGVEMAAVGEGHDEDVGLFGLPRVGVEKGADLAEVDLGFIAGWGLDT